MKVLALFEISLLLIVTVVPVLWRFFRHRLDPLEPLIIILAGYGIFYIIKPLDLILAGRYSIRPMDDYLYVLALLYCLVGLVCFLVGYHAKFPKAVARALPKIPELKSTPLMLAVAFLLLLGFAGFGMTFFSLSDFISYLGVSRYGRGPATYVAKAVISSGLLSSFIILFFVLYAASLTIWRRSRLAKIAAGVSGLWALALFNPFCYSRAAFLTIVIGWLVIRHYLKKPFRTSVVVLMAVVFMVFYVVFGMFRFAGPTAVQWQQRPAVLWNNLMSTRYLDAFENFAFILDTFPQNEPFLVGKTYGALFVNWIPRAFWPNKPIGAGKMVADLYLGWDSGGFTVGPSIFGEAYMNFGYLGPPLVLLVFGWLAQIFYAYLGRCRNASGKHAVSSVLLYACSAPWLLSLVRGEFLSFTVTYVLRLLILLIAIWLIPKLALAAVRSSDSSASENKSSLCKERG